MRFDTYLCICLRQRGLRVLFDLYLTEAGQQHPLGYLLALQGGWAVGRLGAVGSGDSACSESAPERSASAEPQHCWANWKVAVAK